MGAGTDAQTVGQKNENGKGERRKKNNEKKKNEKSIAKLEKKEPDRPLSHFILTTGLADTQTRNMLTGLEVSKQGELATRLVVLVVNVMVS